MFTLFLEFIKIGALSFGGGLSTLPYFFKLANIKHWYGINDVNNMVVISQMTPGPLPCNMATYVGFKLKGILGALVSTLSLVIPAILFMYVFYKFFSKVKGNKKIIKILFNIRASILATIVISSATIFRNTFFINDIILNYKAIIYCVLLYVIIKKKKLSSLLCMIISGFIGVIFSF